MILVADDNHELRTALVEHLRRQGLAVLEAPDGSLALQLVTRNAQQLQVLITDFDMPGLDGLSLIQEARQHRPELRVLLITSRLPTELPSLSPPIDVLMKPFELSELSRRLSRPATTADSTPSVKTQPKSSGWVKRALSLTAAVPATMILVGLLWLQGRPPKLEKGSNLLPAPPIHDQTRSVAVDGLQPLGVMASPPESFQWSPIAGADHYRLSITDLADQVIWQTESSRPTADLSEDLRSHWSPHVAFYLDVRAYAADGSLLASTSGQRVRVVPTRDPANLAAEPFP